MTKPETEWVLVPKKATREMLSKGWEQMPASWQNTRVDYVHFVFEAMLAASPPSPSVPDVVREWADKPNQRTANFIRIWELIGDRMATALTAQAKTIERLEGVLQHVWLHVSTDENFDADELRRDIENTGAINELRGAIEQREAAEATVTAQAKTIERLEAELDFARNSRG